ncbi:unnamed protein product [Amaranthus hypochondriacus]
MSRAAYDGSYSPGPGIRAGSLICEDYLILKPEEGSCKIVLRLLLCDDTTFNYRWLLFVSALMLKWFRFIKTPLAFLGNFMEFSINLISHNHGLLNLFLNFIKGNVHIPNNSSETYRSMVGLLDGRVDLDPKIQLGHVNYEASLSWMASKLSYENSAYIKTIVENRWKMKVLGTYDFRNEFEGNKSTHAMMLRNMSKDNDLTVVAFRGTKPFDADDWCVDLDISWYKLPQVGRVHRGFIKALGLHRTNKNVIGLPKEIEMGHKSPNFAYYKIRQALKNIIVENKDAKFILAGHSLGGALAILFASLLILHEERELLHRLEGVYTFGQPRVGDEEFGVFMKHNLEAYNIKYLRFVYCNDIVPRLPYDDNTLLFKHFGPCLYYDTFYNGKEMEEEPNKNYFSLLWMMPKYLNAGWELLRGFILPYMKWGGPTYKEGWCQHIYRLIGLICPGLSAHGPQDYTNLTRLPHFSLSHDHHKRKL